MAKKKDTEITPEETTGEPDAVAFTPVDKYDPRMDPGPERYEDTGGRAPEVDNSILSSPEVPLEDSRRDDTTVLATDTFDGEGNRTN